MLGEVKGEIDIKRMTLPGLTVEGNCLKCESKITEEFNGDCFNYPVAGSINDYRVMCNNCDTCNVVKLEFTIGVRVKGCGIDE